MGYAAEIFGIFYSQWDYQVVNISRILKVLTWHAFDDLAGMTLLILLKWKKNLLPWIFFVKIERFLLKLVPAIFYQILIFSLNDSPLKTMKIFFISCKKLFLFSRHSNFCKFPSLPTHSRFKSANGSGIIYDAMNWLA